MDLTCSLKQWNKHIHAHIPSNAVIMPESTKPTKPRSKIQWNLNKQTLIQQPAAYRKDLHEGPKLLMLSQKLRQVLTTNTNTEQKPQKWNIKNSEIKPKTHIDQVQRTSRHTTKSPFPPPLMATAHKTLPVHIRGASNLRRNRSCRWEVVIVQTWHSFFPFLSFLRKKKAKKKKKKRHRKHPHQTRPQKGIQIQKQTLELQGFRYFFIYICPIFNTFFWIFNHKTELKKIDKKLRKGSGSFGYQGQNFHSGRGTTERDLQRGIVCELWDFSIPALDTCTACAESGVNFLGTPSMARGQCQRKWCCQRRVSWIWNW